MDVVDALKPNLNADLRGSTRAKMDNELRIALKGPALALQFSASVLRQAQKNDYRNPSKSAFASAPEQRTASEARYPFLHTDHNIPGQRSSAAVRGLQRPSPRVFNPQLRNRGLFISDGAGRELDQPCGQQRYQDFVMAREGDSAAAVLHRPF